MAKTKWFCVLALLLLLSGCSLPPTEKDLAAREGFAECGNFRGSPRGWTIEVRRFGTQFYCKYTMDDSASDTVKPKWYIAGGASLNYNESDYGPFIYGNMPATGVQK